MEKEKTLKLNEEELAGASGGAATPEVKAATDATQKQQEKLLHPEAGESTRNDSCVR